MKKTIGLISILMVVLGLAISGCKKEQPDTAAVKPTADNIEIGYANNKRAIRGRDFHLNADVIAGNKITTVIVQILQKADRTYSGNWKFELTWEEFAGVKNTNVHKHFTVPNEAPEGIYDFVFIVNDENGTRLELREELSIIDAANMPVDPLIDRDIFLRNGTMIYYMNTYVEDPLLFKKNDSFTARTQIKQIQGNGVLYTALINRKLKYFPETVDQLDFSKCVIISKVEHSGLSAGSSISTLRNMDGVWGGDTIEIGAGKDAAGNTISGLKAWETGQYDLVILYHNSSYNISVHKSIPISIQYE
ncbi:DUF4625 domain-containing protein [Niabella sp. 22666]|uniref:DUF4625 domain-containing protein n=1 Tax=Niabella sp. 22666 TaxID=3453954 RepID=UPI003F83BCF9